MRTRPDDRAASTRRSWDRGSATVEFALVLPLVLVVVLGLVQVGLVVRDRLLVEAAAGLDPARGRVDVARSGSRGDPVTVHVTYDDPFRVPLVAWLLGSGVTLTADAAARQEFG